MNRIFWYLKGYVRIRIKGACVEKFLNVLSKDRVPFWDPEWVDAFTVQVCVFDADRTRVVALANKTQCDISIIQAEGLGKILQKLRGRIILLLSVAFCILLIVVSQNYLMFFDVTGNEKVPEEEILRALDELDIHFGTLAANLDPKWIKDHMLNMLPQLQWVTVTQNGCFAHVVVRERSQVPEAVQRRGYANIIASRSGLITDQSISRGQALKQLGDIVEEGELLVSGIVDLERIYSVVYAQAEIFARTWHNKTVIIPQNYQEKIYSDRAHTSVWLEFGKSKIKIFGNSRISTPNCDKIIDKVKLTLPGGYTLPLSLSIESFLPYEAKDVKLSHVSAQILLEEYAYERILDSMHAGRILHYQSKWNDSGGCYQLLAQFECHEMIARTVEGKWNEEDFIND